MDAYANLNADDGLQAENDFMKMKLMLEKGAVFEATEEFELPAEIENRFLKNVIEFEKQFDNYRRVKVVDKIGKPPARFRPVAEISDEEITEEWEQLSAFMEGNGISVTVCSPRVTPRELYRFTMEELLEYQVEDISIPGMMQCFIYDEFYPDIEYEVMGLALDECMVYMVGMKPLEWTHHFSDAGIRLNQHANLNCDELKQKVNAFKSFFQTLEIKRIDIEKCEVKETEAVVSGTYAVAATTSSDVMELTGKWRVAIQSPEIKSFWYVCEVDVEGVNY